VGKKRLTKAEETRHSDGSDKFRGNTSSLQSRGGRGTIAGKLETGRPGFAQPLKLDLARLMGSKDGAGREKSEWLERKEMRGQGNFRWGV